ncbi:hypothetical protein K7432_006325 [Basidiobolus ranarum]|uniref:Uncharacterized protein n=1 Tax=Basidiobolus ranarum TaxID=34480 RepID=A0ABR2WV29_9FUNG
MAMAYEHNSQKSIDSGVSTTSHTRAKSFLTRPAQTTLHKDIEIEEIQITGNPDFAYGSDLPAQNNRCSASLFGVDSERGEGSMSGSKSSFDSTLTSSSHTYPRTEGKDLLHVSFLELSKQGKFDEKTLCSRDDSLKESFDPYKALYSIKFDSFASSINLSSFLSNLKPSKLKKNHRNTTIENHYIGRPVAKVLFYIGFLFFPAWIFGAFYLPSQIKTTGEDYIWRRRNRLTCLILTVFSLISILALIISDPRYFGFSTIR